MPDCSYAGHLQVLAGKWHQLSGTRTVRLRIGLPGRRLINTGGLAVEADQSLDLLFLTVITASGSGTDLRSALYCVDASTDL